MPTAAKRLRCNRFKPRKSLFRRVVTLHVRHPGRAAKLAGMKVLANLLCLIQRVDPRQFLVEETVIDTLGPVAVAGRQNVDAKLAVVVTDRVEVAFVRFVPDEIAVDFQSSTTISQAGRIQIVRRQGFEPRTR